MTFPAIVTSSSGTSAASTSTSHTVTLPASIVAGNLLMVFAFNGSTVAGATTTPAGWNVLYQGNGANKNLAILWRTADGTEGATLALTWSASGRGTWTAYQISGWDPASTPALGTPTTFSSSTGPTSPALTPSWGALDTMWISALGMSAGSGTTVTTYPSGYTLGQLYVQNAGSSIQHSISAVHDNNTATETPGAYAVTPSATGVAATVGVSPVTSSPTTATGAASGLGAATGVGLGLGIGLASAIGAGVATGVGTAIASSIASATGAGAAAATGKSTAASTASAAGAGTASGTGIALSIGTAVSAGVGAALGIGNALKLAVGSAAGAGLAAASGASTAAANGVAAGLGVASGVGASVAAAIASAAGIGTASGIGAAVSSAVAFASGAATVIGRGSAVVTAIALAIGRGIATAFSAPPTPAQRIVYVPFISRAFSPERFSRLVSISAYPPRSLSVIGLPRVASVLSENRLVSIPFLTRVITAPRDGRSVP